MINTNLRDLTEKSATFEANDMPEINVESNYVFADKKKYRDAEIESYMRGNDCEVKPTTVEGESNAAEVVEDPTNKKSEEI
jgi:hypothetical protein